MLTAERNKSLLELEEIFRQVKTNTILGFYLHGLSYREISKRLGGTTPPIVKKILDELRKEEQLDLRKE
jgi:hypothetical protein